MHLIFPFLSGILLLLSFPPYNLEFLAWIALIPLFYFLKLKETSPKKAFLGGSLMGILFFGKLFSWYFSTFPFEWLGVTDKRAIIALLGLLIFFWLIQTIFLSLFFGLFSLGVKKILTYYKVSIFYLFLIPSLWIVLEYLRAHGFGLFWVGQESLLGSHWTFGNLAYALHNKLALIQVASLGGIYLISFLVVLVNVFLGILISRPRRASPKAGNSPRFSQKVLLFFIIVFILMSSIWVGYGSYQLMAKESGKQIKIALLQTNFFPSAKLDSRQKKEKFEILLKLLATKRMSQEQPNLIIFPEGAGLASLLEGSSWSNKKELIKSLLRDSLLPGQIFIENQRVVDQNNKIKSRLFYYSLEEEAPIAYHDKMLLVPNGDFFPFLTKFFLSLYSFDIQNQERFYSPGEEVKIAETPKGIIGGTICSSIISPKIQRQLTNQGAEFLITVSSDAPFHGSRSLLSQNLAMAKLRAVENGRYFAQATNLGYSFLLNQKGEVVSKSSELKNDVLFATVPLLAKKTIYSLFGDWIILLAFLFLSTVLFFALYGKIKRK